MQQTRQMNWLEGLLMKKTVCFSYFVKIIDLRKRCSCVWVLFFLFLIPGSCSRKSENFYHIGILSGLSFFGSIADGFKEQMTELGYEEGKNISYDIQKSEFDTSKYRKILENFITEKVDLVFVFPTEAAVMAKKVLAKTNIPIVFANVFTENMGLINSIREPGGNITGVRWLGTDIILQRLEIMQELVPGIKNIWVPYKKNSKMLIKKLKTLNEVCKLENLVLTEIPANDSSELDSGFQAALQQHPLPDAILMITEPLCVLPATFIVMARFARQHNIPLGGVYMSIDNYRSVFGLAPENIPQGKQAAFIADRILHGTPAGQIAVVSAENFLKIDYDEAKRSGLLLNENLLIRADEVIR